MANACINYRMGVIDILFGNKKLRIKVFNTSQGPQTNDCFKIDILENLVKEVIIATLSQDPLQTCLAQSGVDDFNLEGDVNEVGEKKERKKGQSRKRPLRLTKQLLRFLDSMSLQVRILRNWPPFSQ